MFHEIILLLTFVHLIQPVSIRSRELNIFTEFDYPEVVPEMKSRNLRENFLKKVRQKMLLRNWDKLVPSNTIYVDNVTHTEVLPDWKRPHDIEKEYKSLLLMKYVKYVYQRDSHWRTWRKVTDAKGKNKIVCYKCQSKIHPNCTDCTSRGVWVIEEGMPPCPYELFSVINNNELCASNYTQLGESLRNCPLIIKYADLTKACNNPIVTRWRFSRNYKVSKRTSAVNICDGRDFCEIVTLYQIRPEYVIFRIVNDSQIIYSRIMKVNKQNFACVNNCGIIDLKTYKVTRNADKSTILNLLPNKSKRNCLKKIKTLKNVNSNNTKIEDVPISRKGHPAYSNMEPYTTTIFPKITLNKTKRYHANFYSNLNNILRSSEYKKYKNTKLFNMEGKLDYGRRFGSDDGRNEPSVKNNASYQEFTKGIGHLGRKLPTLPEVTTLSHCRKLIEQQDRSESANADEDDDANYVDNRLFDN